MNLFGKLLIAALIIGMLLPFTILKGKDGKPLMSFSDFKLPDFKTPDLPSLPKLGSSDNTTKTEAGHTAIYQWEDNDGNIQFTTSQPPAGVEYEVKGYDPDTNVIQSVNLPEAGKEAVEPAKTEENAATDGIGTVYSPEKINKLIDDAKNVEKLLNDRLKNQNAVIGE